jgi:NAD(P)H-flavin reductase
MKHPYSPLQLLLKGSHETIVAWHEVNGRIILTLFGIHVTFYSNFFVQNGMFWTNMQHLHLAVGLISAIIFLTIGITATGYFRRKNYPWFYKVHVVGSTIVLPLLFIHVHHIRLYVFESAAVLTMNVVLRMFSSRTFNAEISTVPRSNGLVKVSIKHPGGFTGGWLPGEHVYFRESSSGILSYFSKNPFTISTLPADGRDVVLVARRANGNTKNLYATASLADGTHESKVPANISLEGPYGYSRYLHAPSEFSRVLFIAGGVGATYIVPLWRYFHQARTPHQEIRLVWAVRTVADAEWAFEHFEDVPTDPTTGFQADERELSVTGNGLRQSAESNEEAIELLTRDHERDEEGDDNSSAAKAGFVVSTGRPDLRMMVDVTVSGNNGRSAIFVCGPTGMVSSVRAMVGKWIERGEDVYWHAEEFGM